MADLDEYDHENPLEGLIFDDSMVDDEGSPVEGADPKAPVDKFYCAGADRKDEDGKKLCNYKAPKKWGPPCPKCRRWYDCLKIKRNEAETNKTHGTLADEVEDLKYNATGVPELDRVLNGGVVFGNTVLLGGKPGLGKPLACDTPVPTPTGWTTQGALRAGDKVFGPDGRIANILGGTGPMSGKPCYRLEFSDGSSIVADADHPWSTLTDRERHLNVSRSADFKQKRRARRPRRGTGKKPYMVERNIKMAQSHIGLPQIQPQVRTTAEIASTLMFKGRVNHSIEKYEPVDLPHVDLPVPPYTLGAWLGDGDSKAGMITTIDGEILQQIASEGFEITRHSDPYNYGVLKLKAKLVAAGVWKNKHIPSVYLRASVEQRVELLRGLMDTDGWLEGGCCRFGSTSKKLFAGVLELVRSLGIVTQPRTVMKTCTNSKTRAQSLCYTICFTTPIRAFHLTRKLELQKTTVNVRSSRRYITAVVPVESVPVCCVQTDREDGLYLVGEQWITTHNTRLLLRAIDSFAKPDRKAMFISGEDTKQRVQQFAKQLGIKNPNVDVWGDPQGITIDTLPNEIRGRKIKLVIFDSVQALAYSERKADFGDPAQVKTVCNYVTAFAKSCDLGVIMIGQQTQAGIFAGGEALIHGVDVVLRLDTHEMYDDDGDLIPGSDSLIRLHVFGGKSRQGNNKAESFLVMSDDGKVESPPQHLMKHLSKIELVR